MSAHDNLLKRFRLWSLTSYWHKIGLTDVQIIYHHVLLFIELLHSDSSYPSSSFMITQSLRFPSVASGVQMVSKSDVWRNIIDQIYHHQHHQNNLVHKIHHYHHRDAKSGKHGKHACAIFSPKLCSFLGP